MSGTLAKPNVPFASRSVVALFAALGLCATWGCMGGLRGTPRIEEPAVDRRAVSEGLLADLPLYFVENQGQEDERVAFAVHGRTTSLYFTSEGVTVALTGAGTDEIGKPTPSDTHRRPSLGGRSAATRRRWAVKLDFVGANPGMRPEGRDATPAVVSYFSGDPDRWRTAVRTYASVLYRDVWPGIDVVYTGTGKGVESTFVVRPGADPGSIRLAYRGATAVGLTAAGRLDVTTPVGSFAEDKPYAYQEGSEAIEVASAFTLRTDEDGTASYGIAVGAYDRGRPLMLDPVILVYAGYIGGNDFEGPSPFGSSALALDEDRNAYVTGETISMQATFPVLAGPDVTYNGDSDAFVAKVRADGKGLVYAGFIGGLKTDFGNAIAVDDDGYAYVTGVTDSDQTSFPVFRGPDLTFNGGNCAAGECDAFVAKVKRDGRGLVYAGYIGGADFDFGNGIAVDEDGAAYVTGNTLSDERTFPVLRGPDLTFNGGPDGDAFVAKVRPDGKGLIYAGYIGGSGSEFGRSIAVDRHGYAFVTGETDSTQATFPVHEGPDLRYNGGLTDAFVAKVRQDGKRLVFAGYIGGAGDDFGSGIAVDDDGDAYIAGDTDSTAATFPVHKGPDTTFNGDRDAFVAKVKSDGEELVYAGYIGGAGADSAQSIAVDASENAYVTGRTTSTQATFPVTGGPDVTFNGGQDAFVAKVQASGKSLSYAGYIGGSGDDAGRGIAVDRDGNAYVAGYTTSTQATFPVVRGPDLTFNGAAGDYDTFVAKIRAK